MRQRRFFLRFTLWAALVLACGCSDSGSPPPGSCEGSDKELLTGDVAALRSDAATARFQTSTLALTSDHVHWVDPGAGTASDFLGAQTGSIRRVPKAGGPPEDVYVAPSDREVRGVAATATTLFALFFADYGDGWGAFLGEVGAGPTLERLTPTRTHGWDWAGTGLAGVHDGDVWVVTIDDGDDLADGEARILRVSPAGDETVVVSRAKMPASFVASLDAIEIVGLTIDTVYFMVNQGTDGIFAMDAQGVGEATSLEVTLPGLLAGLTTVGEGFLYTYAGTLRRFALADAPIADVGSGELVMDTNELLGGVGRVGAFDAGRLVILPWNNDAPAPAYRADLDGSALEPIVCDAVGTDSFQNDGSHWYWIDGPVGEAAAIARTPY